MHGGGQGAKDGRLERDDLLAAVIPLFLRLPAQRRRREGVVKDEAALAHGDGGGREEGLEGGREEEAGGAPADDQDAQRRMRRGGRRGRSGPRRTGCLGGWPAHGWVVRVFSYEGGLGGGWRRRRWAADGVAAQNVGVGVG